jgi:Ser/Thr protein kinase RdoA (MazF antagonist)
MGNYNAFGRLTPDQLLAAIERQGYRCDGRILALNSYENRVYQVGLEEDAHAPLIAKFYRPQRWSDAAIIEEHRFTLELAAAEIPVIAPLPDAAGATLHHDGPFRFALYPRCGGQAPELDNPRHLEVIGRTLARIHLLGETTRFRHRPALEVASLGREPARYLLDSGLLPKELGPVYRSVVADLLTAIEDRFRLVGEVRTVRLHGDCHIGNILWRDGVPHIVDFDDACQGPAIQDLWLFLSGDRAYRTARLGDLLEGYSQFRDFDPRELHLIEALRSLRLIHYAAWLARRKDEPAFQRAFPWFASPRYWDEHILSLREQRAVLDEPPLVWLA